MVQMGSSSAHLVQTRSKEKGDPAKKYADCHSPLKEEGVKLNRLKTAYHKQCCNCYIEVNAQGMAAPFEKCTECHLDPNNI